ncbi:hypothetical protein SAMN05192550_2878 [Flavobacterium glycines]|uniref:Uncharacterized protein n=1 Tax=Flavobacterium glycines TaxID=551990 RepID=A0A1B9DSV0_9FLAO|nr:hypothetical protein [Flavobacterium glycines]OCB72768.1 hypothetical protein FBGL_05460 [Flavobacterium glycines]GEL11748.1 hypothetical protein FGL01_24870 [Flavobacterium glycines]SDJ83826.1 hypothetical protein SAMN05192550_2878 [Flavobacterium glycines]
MNKILTVVIGLLLIALTSFTTEKTTSGFQETLQKTKMSFSMPKDFKETTIIPNNHMNYEYAIKHIEKNFEVRFAIRPLGDRMTAFYEKEKNKKTGEVNLSPNKSYQASFLAITMNVSGIMDKLPRTSTFPQKRLKLNLMPIGVQ